jgi:GNAT superfamily N-acetyltransferase
VASEDAQICGYLFEFDKRIVHTHGTAESVARLLHCTDLDEPTLVIEPHHLVAVKELFETLEPTDPTSRSKITTYLVMEAYAETLKPLISHRVKRLGSEDFDEVLKQFGDEWKRRIEDAIGRGLAFGAYENDALASLSTAPEILDTVALIRGVYTLPSLRGKGFATSVCSAIAEELISLGKEAVLWVATDNLPARKVYEKIGFKETQRVLLGFKARRLSRL